MQGHIAVGQQHIVGNQQEQFRIMATLNDKVECVLDKLEHIMGNHDQFLQTLTVCSYDSAVVSTYSDTGDPIDLFKPTTPMPTPVA
jgi:hypothetical protein